MGGYDTSYGQCTFETKKIFEDGLQILILSILKEAYRLLMKDKHVKIKKNDELKCSAQIAYFAIKVREYYYYPFLFETEIPLNDFHNIVYGNLSPKESSRLDITIRHRDWDEESFMTVESKRLDGSKTLADKYVEKGIERFVKGQYSFDNNCSFMIGFVVNGNGSDNIPKINACVITKYNESETLREIKKDIDYVSIHTRKKGYSPFKIIHFFADLNALKL